MPMLCNLINTFCAESPVDMAQDFACEGEVYRRRRFSDAGRDHNRDPSFTLTIGVHMAVCAIVDNDRSVDLGRPVDRYYCADGCNSEASHCSAADAVSLLHGAEHVDDRFDHCAWPVDFANETSVALQAGEA